MTDPTFISKSSEDGWNLTQKPQRERRPIDTQTPSRDSLLGGGQRMWENGGRSSPGRGGYRSSPGRGYRPFHPDTRPPYYVDRIPRGDVGIPRGDVDRAFTDTKLQQGFPRSPGRDYRGVADSRSFGDGSSLRPGVAPFDLKPFRNPLGRQYQRDSPPLSGGGRGGGRGRFFEQRKPTFATPKPLAPPPGPSLGSKKDFPSIGRTLRVDGKSDSPPSSPSGVAMSTVVRKAAREFEKLQKAELENKLLVDEYGNTRFKTDEEIARDKREQLEYDEKQAQWVRDESKNFRLWKMWYAVELRELYDVVTMDIFGEGKEGFENFVWYTFSVTPKNDVGRPQMPPDDEILRVPKIKSEESLRIEERMAAIGRAMTAEEYWKLSQDQRDALEKKYTKYYARWLASQGDKDSDY